jgi:hypothetical protein
MYDNEVRTDLELCNKYRVLRSTVEAVDTYIKGMSEDQIYEATIDCMSVLQGYDLRIRSSSAREFIGELRYEMHKRGLADEFGKFLLKADLYIKLRQSS